jgi:hypothetical protein
MIETGRLYRFDYQELRRDCNIDVDLAMIINIFDRSMYQFTKIA